MAMSRNSGHLQRIWRQHKRTGVAHLVRNHARGGARLPMCVGGCVSSLALPRRAVDAIRRLCPRAKPPDSPSCPCPRVHWRASYRYVCTQTTADGFESRGVRRYRVLKHETPRGLGRDNPRTARGCAPWACMPRRDLQKKCNLDVQKAAPTTASSSIGREEATHFSTSLRHSLARDSCRSA